MDSIYTASKSPDVKGVRDALLFPANISMLLLVAEVLVPINYFSKFLQTKSLNYASVKSKLEKLIVNIETIKQSLNDYDVIDSSLTHFNKIIQFLTISTERMELARNLRDRVLANAQDIKTQVNHFLHTVGYNFVDSLLVEINKVLEETTDILVAYDVFNPDNYKRESLLYCEEKFTVLANHYGSEIFDEMNRDTVHAAPLISKYEQKAEINEFVIEFNEKFDELKQNVSQEADRKLHSNLIKRNQVAGYIADNRPVAEDIYAVMCSTGFLQRYPETMKLFKYALLIPPSTSNVELGFSTMNLLVSPLRTSLGEKSRSYDANMFGWSR